MQSAPDGLLRAVELLHVHDRVYKRPASLIGHETWICDRSPEEQVCLSNKRHSVIALHVDAARDNLRIASIEKLFYRRDQPGRIHLLLNLPHANGPAGHWVSFLDQCWLHR